MTVPSPIRPQIDAWAAADRDRPADAPEVERPGAGRGVRTEALAVEDLVYGPEPEGEAPACRLVSTLGEIEAEYAAVRRGAGLLDAPHRGIVVLRGDDRRDFLNRLVTNELKDLVPGRVVETFLTNRKGRLEADLLVIDLDDRTLLETDVHQVDRVLAMLDEFLFGEDVEVTDARASLHAVQVHGPKAEEVIGAAIGVPFTLAPRACVAVAVDGHEVVVARRDQAGTAGLVCVAGPEAAAALWEYLVAADGCVCDGQRRVRPIGWHAYNIARIEAGTPLFNVDFGATNLPHETGLLETRVSFTKGCYPGQEVVARMQNLGRPKQVLVGLRLSDDAVPVAGDPVFAAATPEDGDEPPTPIGAVTSSTVSPMLGAAGIGFAMLRSAHAAIGTTVRVPGDGVLATAEVAPLRFLPDDAEPAS